MQEIVRRAVRATAAAGSAAALMVLLAAPASAAPGAANSSAYAISANVLNIVTVAPTPVSTFPSGVDHTLVSLNAPLLGTAVLNAITDGDANGNSSATGSAASVALLPVTGALAAVTADVISATCTADGTTESGSATLTNAKIGTTALAASPGPNTNVSVPGVATVTLNEQTTAGGVLTVNAIHIQLGTNGALGDIIIGHAVCGPNTPVLGSPILTSEFYVGFGALGILALGAYLVRRRTSAHQA